VTTLGCFAAESSGIRWEVRAKCPKWFVPICNSKPSEVVDFGVCITQESDSKLLAIIRAAHALLAAGDAEAARDLLASFSSPGVDALC